MSTFSSLTEKLGSIENLPSIPHTLHKVLTALDDVIANSDTLEDIIKEDPSLTVKLLHSANSPYYGQAGQINSISRAILLMGMNEMRSLVIGVSLSNTFSGKITLPGFSARDIWLHSVAVATASKLIAETQNDIDPDELFTAGMLHDIGRFVLCLFLTNEYAQVLRLHTGSEKTLYVIEDENNLSHAEVGAYLAHRWGLSEFLMSVVRYHHRPQGAGPYLKPASVVFLADIICKKLRIGTCIDEEKEKILVPKVLGLSQDVVKKIVMDMKVEKSRLELTWGAVLID